MDDDDDDLGDLTQATPAYKRVLWTVLLLNIGYGIIEAVGGFLAGSQGLKADALDFVADGTITLLGVLAISWGQLWRARAALLQGIFLGLMGIGVLALTAYRVVVLQVPEADLMGAFGIGALVVNVICAVLLLRHREGDANVRAVWLFSRNDAIGNALVIVAAVFVWLTSTAWPDLIVAALIALLFLQSSWKIVTGARHEIAEHGEKPQPGDRAERHDNIGPG
jgi:cation diffusion facilitator family transporter